MKPTGVDSEYELKLLFMLCCPHVSVYSFGVLFTSFTPPQSLSVFFSLLEDAGGDIGSGEIRVIGGGRRRGRSSYHSSSLSLTAAYLSRSSLFVEWSARRQEVGGVASLMDLGF
jgi:hypothetical protein